MEEVAENYLKELVDRNLVLVGKLRLNKKLKTCFVHDLVRDLCLTIGEKENFYFVQRDIDGKHYFIVNEGMARFYSSEFYTPVTPSIIHPIIFPGQRAEPSNSRLLRILFLDALILDPFREVNLRFLMYQSFHFEFNLFSSISMLWSLQTLIVPRSVRATPCEIWKMPQLRHINIKESICVPEPPPNDDVFVLQNLQTLETVENLILTKEVCKRIPNIKKLGIRFNAQGEEASSSSYHVNNVACLNKLESLRCSCYEYEYVSDLLRNLKLPSSLKKLTLKGSRLLWSDMAMIGSLPRLQILKLLDDAVVGEKWNCVEGEFPCLKHLHIGWCGDLTYWIADSSSFPVLEMLSLGYLAKMEEIPSGIGDVPTLQKINLFGCTYSAAISAVKILEEQESLGNLDLRLQIIFKYKSEAEKLWEEIEELDIMRKNLVIDTLDL